MSEEREMPPELKEAIHAAVADVRGALDRLRARVKVMESELQLRLSEAAVWTAFSVLISEHLWTRAQADGRTREQALLRAERYLQKLVQVITRDVARYLPETEDPK